MSAAATYDTPIKIERNNATQDPTFGTAVDNWQSITGDRYILAEVRDDLPSRQEGVQNGLEMARSRTRVRFPYRTDVGPEMRVTIYRGTGADVYQIIGGPAELGRQEATELFCEAYSS